METATSLAAAASRVLRGTALTEATTPNARNADLDHKNKELLKKLEAFNVENSKHGDPPVSGSSAASDAPQDPLMDLGDSAVEQV